MFFRSELDLATARSEPANGYGHCDIHSFMLDAEIDNGAGSNSWIRPLAVPMIDGGSVVGVHGVKRGL